MTNRQLLQFVVAERQRLVGYVRSLQSDIAGRDAEDLVHDVLLKLLDRADPTVPLENLGAYVYRALRNRVIDHARTSRPMVSLDTENGAPAGFAEAIAGLAPTALEVLQSERARERLFAAMETLKPIERDVLIANEFEGRPFRELADSWNVPLNTLLSHKSRAVRKLARQLTDPNDP